jgi:hypothetical protein
LDDVAYAVFDMADKTLDYLCAGHPYPWPMPSSTAANGTPATVSLEVITGPAGIFAAVGDSGRRRRTARRVSGTR